MSGLSYHSRLKELNSESLELRRLRADLLLTYKILFHLLCLNSDAFFYSKKSVAFTRSSVRVRQATVFQ